MKKSEFSLFLLLFLLFFGVPTFAINERLIADSNRYPMSTFEFYYSRSQPYFYFDPITGITLNYK